MAIQKRHQYEHDNIQERGEGICKWCGKDYSEILFLDCRTELNETPEAEPAAEDPIVYQTY